MHLPGRDMHHVPHLQQARRLPPRTHQPHPHRDGEDLPELVVVPEGAGTGGEAHVVGHATEGWGGGVGLTGEDRVHVDGAGEGGGWLAGGGGGLVRGAD